MKIKGTDFKIGAAKLHTPRDLNTSLKGLRQQLNIPTVNWEICLRLTWF